MERCTVGEERDGEIVTERKQKNDGERGRRKRDTQQKRENRRNTKRQKEMLLERE